MKVIKVYDRFHTLLDEISEFTALSYTWTLNGLGSCTFNTPLESLKCTTSNFNFKNQIEVIDENNNIIWCGQIVTRGFTGDYLTIGAYGYLSLLSKRRMTAKSYASMNYGSLCMNLITDVNAIYDTGIKAGTIATNTISAQMATLASDMCLDKITSYSLAGNFEFEVDANRLFNYFLKKGSDKSNKYVLEYGGGEADNILINPTLDQSFIDSANTVYGATTTSVLSNTVSSLDSIAQYGQEDNVVSVGSDVIVQTTLNACTNAQLQKIAYNTNSITLKVRDSVLCPFGDITLGDYIMVSLIPFWNFKQAMRIIEMTQDDATGQRSMVVGECVYRPQPPEKKIFMR